MSNQCGRAETFFPQEVTDVIEFHKLDAEYSYLAILLTYVIRSFSITTAFRK